MNVILQTLCDVGLTATDNGLITKITGETLTYTMGVDESIEISPLHYTRKLKMNNVRSRVNFRTQGSVGRKYGL